MDNIDLIDDIISTAKEPTVDDMDTFKIINNNKHLTCEELLAKIFNKDEREIIVKKTIRRIIPKVSMSLDI